MRVEEDGVDHRCCDPGTHLLHHQPAFNRDLGESPTRTAELMVQHGLRVPVECTGAAAQRATTAGRAAGSAPRTRLGAGVVSVNPQNMSAMPISSPR